MQIVTGFRGENHITSNDDQGRNQGIFGTGAYVLPVRSQFEASIVSANDIQIGDGEGVLQGVHFRTEPTDSDLVTVNNGTQGMNRADLIVVRYEKDAGTGVEDVSLSVKTGTPTAGEASPPAYVEGDILAGDLVAEMPLYQVNLAGVSIDSIEPLFSLVPSLDGVTDFCESKETAVRHPAGTAVGSANKPIYVDADGNATAANTFVPTSGGTFAGNITINRSDGTAGTQGSSLLYLGNSTKVGTAGNSYGALRLYSMTAGDAQTYYVTLLATGQTANRNLYLKHNATADNVYKANGSTAVGSGTNPVYVSAAGAATASTSSAGTSSRPVYLNDGTITAMSDWFNQSVKTTASPTFSAVTISSGSIVKSSGELVFEASSNSYSVNAFGKGLVVRNKANTAYAPAAASAFNVNSSRRVKENVKDMSEDEARKILDVNIVDFDYIAAVGGAKNQHGVIAEDVVSAIPYAVYIPDGYDEKSEDLLDTPAVDYSKFVPYLIKMVQMQAAEIAELKSRVEALEK